MPPCIITVKRLIADEEWRRESGEAMRDFVANSWNETAVAGRLGTVMEGPVPDDWFFEPASIEYVEGAGMSETRRRTMLRALLKEQGPGALGLRLHQEGLERMGNLRTRNLWRTCIQTVSAPCTATLRHMLSRQQTSHLLLAFS